MNINHTKALHFPGLGNGLVADQDLEPGDVIIGIAEPYLLVVELAALDRVCSQCFTAAPNGLKRCGACKIVQYCSAACQSTAWKSIHKEECRIFRKLPRAPSTAVRALMQLLLRGVVAGGSSDPRWVRLESHTSELQRNNRWDDILLQAKVAVEWTASPNEYMESVVNVICRMATNAFRVTMADDTPIGLCFEPSASLANHSCTPNTVIGFDGRYMTLRALDPIKKGEQIFISYVDVTQTLDARRQELEERYFFTCHCAKCETNDGPYGVFLKSLPIVDPRLELFHGQEEAREIAQARCSETAQVHEEAFVDKVDELLSRIQDESTTSTKRLPLLKEALALCSPLRERKLFAQPPYPVTLNELYLHYLTAPSTYTKALSVLLFIYLNCDLYNYPQPHHPIRVTRLFSIAKLLKTIEGLQNIDLVSANQTLLLCVRSLGSKSHGSESRFMKEVEEEIEDVETVQRTRGDVGVRLAEWSKEGTAEVGREYARKIFEGLRNIADDALSGVLNKS